MPEIKKYSTKDELLAADEKYHGSTAVVGKSSLRSLIDCELFNVCKKIDFVQTKKVLS